MIAIWLINWQHPFVMVEDPELIEIFRYLNPTAQIVKADAIKNVVIELYRTGKQELKVSLMISLIFIIIYAYNVADTFF